MKRRMFIASLFLSIVLAGCSSGGESAGENSGGNEPAVAAESSADKAPPSGNGKGDPACGNELLDRLPSSLPFPEGARIYSVCESANEYGSGIAVSYQWTGEAEKLAQLYRDALEGEYEYGGISALDITTMEFTKGEEAILIEIDASNADSKLSVHLSHGIYGGGFDKAQEKVFGDIVGQDDSD